MGETLTIFTYCWLKLGNSIFTYRGLINLWAVFMYCFFFLNIKYTRVVTLNHGKKCELGMSQDDMATEREQLSLRKKESEMAFPAPI